MEENKTKLFRALTVMVVIAALLLTAKIVTEIKGYRFIGGGVSATNMISVSGEGEVFAAPDIATVSFTVREEAKKVVDAQTKVSIKVKAALAGVRKLNVEEKDIKTANYSSYPMYEYREMKIECTASYCPPQGKRILVAYEVSQTVTITVRNLDNASAIVDVLAQADVVETQGPNFAIDKEDELKAKARKQAIEKARAKAEVLAKDLGVSLVRVVSFSEDGRGYSYGPMEEMAFAKNSIGGRGATPAPEIPKGEEKITSNVTVTYEIR